MLYRSTDQYKTFRCTAADCPENCCEGWQIVIDEESLERYQTDGIEGIDWGEGCFEQQERRCNMLLENGLCKLHCEHGEDYLCETCKRYPRHTEEYEGEREYSLSLSCPEVARMLLNRTEPLRFVEWEDDSEDDFEEFDYLLYTKLQDARELMIQTIQNREIPLSERMGRLLTFAWELQNYVDQGMIYAIDEYLEEFRNEPQNEWDFEDDLEHFDALFELETLNDTWTDVLNDGYDFMEGEHFQEQFEEALTQHAVEGEQLLFFFVYTYFCGAVYDELIFSKAALSVYSVRWIMALFLAQCSLHPELDPKQILIEVAYHYAREIEHSDFNVNALDQYFAEM